MLFKESLALYLIRILFDIAKKIQFENLNMYIQRVGEGNFYLARVVSANAVTVPVGSKFGTVDTQLDVSVTTKTFEPVCHIGRGTSGDILPPHLKDIFEQDLKGLGVEQAGENRPIGV